MELFLVDRYFIWFCVIVIGVMEVYVGFNRLIKGLKECSLCFRSRKVDYSLVLDYIPVGVRVMFVVYEPVSGFFYDLSSGCVFRDKFLDLLFEAGLIGGRSLEAFAKRRFYLSYVVKCRGGSVSYCKRFLREEIRVLSPRIICTLGESALRVFLRREETGLREYVGSFVPSRELRSDMTLGTPVFACYYPGRGPVSDSIKVEHFRRLKFYLSKY